MLTIHMRHVRKRGPSWHYRRVVPPAARANLKGRRYWTATWPKDMPTALVYEKALALTARHDREIAVALGREVDVAAAESVARELLATGEQFGYMDLTRGDASPQTAAVVSALEHGGRYIPDAPALSLALEQDIERYGGDRDNYPFESSVASFIALTGDSPITAISRADALAWIDSLRAKGYAPATLRKRVGNMRGLLNRAFLDLEYQGLNPFAKHRLQGNGSVTDRLPFNVAMLAMIDAHLAGSARMKSETRHVLQIMKCTGASPKEIGGLIPADCILDGPIPYIWVRVNSQRGIKAQSRDRQIPLVGVALEAVSAALEAAKVRGGDKLFSGFGGKGGADAKLISKNINKAVHAAGIPTGGRLSAYSYRHTFAESLRSADVPGHTADRLMGHTIPGIAGKYGTSRALLTEAKAAVEKALEHLGRVDDAIYSEAERL